MGKRKSAFLKGAIAGLLGAGFTTTASIFAIISFCEGELTAPDFIRYLVVSLFVIAFALFIAIGSFLHKARVAQIGGLLALVALPVALLVNNTPVFADIKGFFEASWSYATGSLFDFGGSLVLLAAGAFLAYAAGNKDLRAGQITVDLCQVGAFFFTTAFAFFVVSDILSYGAYLPSLFGADGVDFLVMGIGSVLTIFYEKKPFRQQP